MGRINKAGWELIATSEILVEQLEQEADCS